MPILRYRDPDTGQYVEIGQVGPPGQPGQVGPAGPNATKNEVSVSTATPSSDTKLWATNRQVKYLSAPGVWTQAADFGGERLTDAAPASATSDGVTKDQVDALVEHDTGWTAVTQFSNGWVNHDGGWPPLRYKKTTAGVVHVSGLIKNGTFGPSAAICYLPPGFRPTGGRIIFMQMRDNGYARVNVFPDGALIAESRQNNQWGWLSIHLSFYAEPAVPGPIAPTNFKATNLGAATNSVNLGWDARSGATAYKIYYQTTGGRVHHGTTSSLSYTVGGMSNHTNHSFFLEAMDGNGNVSTTPAGPVKVRSGAPGSTVPASTGYVSGSVQSVNRWRANQWGYGGSNQPYVGWWNTEANRYHAFFEIPDWLLRNAIFAAYPQLNGFHHSVACTAAGIFFSRAGNVGNYNNSYTIQVSLGDGISYGNSAEPGQPGNVQDISVYPVANGRVGYSLHPIWYQAIYQNHSAYNGLLFRAYNSGGGRQPYMAFNAGDVIYDMSLSWGNITTGTPTYTKAW